MLVPISTFLLSWRGFLLEGRRHWHAHHRPGLLGRRGGYLLGAPLQHQHQLFKVAALLTQIFARGGHVWGFGVVGYRQRYGWGTLFARWRPGVLSNYFFVRVRRRHFAQRVAHLLRVYHRGHRRGHSGGAKLATRWARLRLWGGLPPAVYTQGRRAALHLGYARVLSSFARYTGVTTTASTRNWRPTTAWLHAPHGGWYRTRYLRRWWRTARKVVAGATVTTPTTWFCPGGWATLTKWSVIAALATAVTQRQRRRSAPVTRTHYGVTWVTRAVRRATTTRAARRANHYHPGRVKPTPRVLSRVVGWPSYFPAAVAAGGLSLVGSNLIHEVNGGGLPLCHFGGTGFEPTASVWHVTWNQQGWSLHGVKHLLLALHRGAHYRGVLRLVWQRLSL